MRSHPQHTPTMAEAASSSRPTTRQRKKRPLLLAALLLTTTPSMTARSTRYPVGVCDANCTLSPLPCPGQTCGPLSPSACNRYLAPTTDPESDARPWTYCTFDFDVPCTDDHLDCPRCALRQIALHVCTPAQRCVPNDDKGYAVMKAAANTDPQTPPGQACFTTQHYLLVPYRPCVGVESPDPRCTGRRGEWYWGYAWDEARARGFGDPNGPLAGLPWGVLLNPKNGRSQHQAHFRIALLQTNLTEEHSNAVVPNYLAQPSISTDPRQPTFTWGERSALFASFFIPLTAGSIDARVIATRVRPFKRATAVAKAAMPLTMYGVLLTPWSQQQQTGVAVTAFFNARGSVLMGENVSDVSPENCTGPCAIYGLANSVGITAAVVDSNSDEALFGLFA